MDLLPLPRSIETTMSYNTLNVRLFVIFFEAYLNCFILFAIDTTTETPMTYFNVDKAKAKVNPGVTRRFLDDVLNSFTPAERSMLLSNAGINWKLGAAAAQHLSFGSPGYNNLIFWSTLGGLLPSYAKGVINAPAELRVKSRFAFVKADGFKTFSSLEELAALGKGSVVLIEPRTAYLGLKSKVWDKLVRALQEQGVIFVTLNDLMVAKLLEAQLGAEGFANYEGNLKSEPHIQNGKVYTGIKLGEYHSFYFRHDEEGMYVIDGVGEDVLLNSFSINGHVIVDRHLVFALVVNYLATARSYRVMQGRKAYLANVFVDDINVGFTHDLLDLNKAWKNGNIIVSATTAGYVPLITKGGPAHNLKASRQYHAMGIPTFLHKAAKWLLVGDGARSVGMDLNAEGDVSYMTNVDKASKMMGRYLHGVPTALTPEVCESGIKIRIDGKDASWKGHPYVVCRVQSPLVEEGSGNGMGHPEMNGKVLKYQKSVVTETIPGKLLGKAGLENTLVLPKVGDRIKPGQRIVAVKSMLNESVVIPVAKNDGVMEAIVERVETVWNKQTSMMSIKVTLLQESGSDAQKYRGTGKYRIHDFCRNVKVTHKGDTIFNPKKPLLEGGVQHLVGDEEGKTMTQVIEMAANVIGATWLGSCWDKEVEIQQWIKANHKLVKVTRSNVEPNTYALLKHKFGADPDFEFIDQLDTIIHSNANAWVGTVVEVIEVPLTETFLTSTTLFGEVIGYMAIHYPHLYGALMVDTFKNQIMAEKVYEMAKEPEDLLAVVSDPYIVLDPSFGTKVNFGDKFNVGLATMSVLEAEAILGIDEGTYNGLAAQGKYLFKVDTITIPVGELGLDTLRGIHKCLDTYNAQFKAAGAAINFQGFNVWVSNGTKDKTLHVYPAVLARAAGTVNHNIAQGFLRILFLLATETGVVDQEVEVMRQRDSWEGLAYRLVSMLQGAIESMAVESNSLLAKVAKTGRVGFQARVATTIDKRCTIEECRMNPITAKLLGLVTGDVCLVGRNPMPKMGALRLVVDDRVPEAVLMMNALAWHAFNEGDADGDSVFWIAISESGDIVLPNLNGKRELMAGNAAIYAEVSAELGPLSAVGYWQARGLLVADLSPEVLINVPYHEFHENNSAAGAKKNLMGKANVLSMPVKPVLELEGFYEGTVITQSVAIATGFFLYSASEIAFHKLLASASRQLGVPAHYKSVLSAAGPDLVLELVTRNMSMEICARMFYEGAGSLGGYKPEVWLLWGRLRGIGCPTDQNLLSGDDAKDAAAAYREAPVGEKLRLFKGWFAEAYGSEFAAMPMEHAVFLEKVGDLLWSYYNSFTLYTQYERGQIKPDFISNDALSVEEKTMILDAIIAGMYRRVNKGIMESGSLDYKDAQQLSWAMMYSEGGEDDVEFPISDVVTAWFTDHTGNLTTFGLWFTRSITVSNIRVSLIKGINERAEHMSEAQIDQLRRNGLKTAATKRIIVEGV